MLSYEFFAAWLRTKVDSEQGASLVEYALLLALIAIVCISAVTMLGSATSRPFSNLGNSGLSPN